MSVILFLGGQTGVQNALAPKNDGKNICARLYKKGVQINARERRFAL